MGLENEPRASKVILLLGGARSGKSTLAEKLAAKRANGPSEVLYVATLSPADTEMRERVTRHRAARPAEWRTVEAPHHLFASVKPLLPGKRVVLLDCLTVWTSNLLLEISDPSLQANHMSAANLSEVLEPDREETVTSELQAEVETASRRQRQTVQPDYERLESRITAELEKLIAAIQEAHADLILVSNEVGMGLVPPYPLGRVYRDLLGRVNAHVATLADEVYIMFAGIPVELKHLQARLLD